MNYTIITAETAFKIISSPCGSVYAFADAEQTQLRRLNAVTTLREHPCNILSHLPRVLGTDYVLVGYRENQLSVERLLTPAAPLRELVEQHLQSGQAQRPSHSQQAAPASNSCESR